MKEYNLDLVSVIVPIYKVEKYVDRCINSIVLQTYKNLEIILVDDGSPDRCPVICDEWSQKDSRIKVIHKINGGLSDARNAGLEAATGEYIAFIDSDDYIHPQFIEVLYYAMRENEADVVSCEYIKVSRTIDDGEIEPIDCKNIKMKNVERISQEAIGGVAWNKLYKRYIFNNIRFPVGKIHEDEGIWWKVVYYAKKIVAVDEILYYYFQNVEGIMHQPVSIKCLDFVDVIYAQYEEFRKMNERSYANRILKFCLNSYPRLYAHLRNQSEFTRKDQRLFAENYRNKVKKILGEKDLDIVFKVKHLTYSYVPISMRIMSRRNKRV